MPSAKDENQRKSTAVPNTDAWWGVERGICRFDPRPAVRPIIEVLAKHKVPLYFVDQVFDGVRDRLQYMIVQSRMVEPADTRDDHTNEVGFHDVAIYTTVENGNSGRCKGCTTEEAGQKRELLICPDCQLESEISRPCESAAHPKTFMEHHERRVRKHPCLNGIPDLRSQIKHLTILLYIQSGILFFAAIMAGVLLLMK